MGSLLLFKIPQTRQVPRYSLAPFMAVWCNGGRLYLLSQLIYLPVGITTLVLLCTYSSWILEFCGKKYLCLPVCPLTSCTDLNLAVGIFIYFKYPLPVFDYSCILLWLHVCMCVSHRLPDGIIMYLQYTVLYYYIQQLTTYQLSIYYYISSRWRCYERYYKCTFPLA